MYPLKRKEKDVLHYSFCLPNFVICLYLKDLTYKSSEVFETISSRY